VTIQFAAFVAHQIVQGLRNGYIAGIQFGKVIIVGRLLLEWRDRALAASERYWKLVRCNGCNP
jgi:hypothetical protein